MMDGYIKLFFSGDLYPAGGSADLLRQFQNDTICYVKSITNEYDYSITNLEAPLCQKNCDYNPINKTGPNIFGCSDTIIGIKEMGFNVVSLANNHIMDMGSKALKDTLDVCKEYNIQTYGAADNLTNARKALVLKKNNLKVGLLAFAENEFCNTNGEEFGANPLKLTDNFRDIRSTKMKCDKVVVSLHGGIEMYNLPAPYIKDICHFFVEAGADAIIVHHTHCYSGYEVYNDAPIFYSLGNFLFESVHTLPCSEVNLWGEGYSVELLFTKESTDFKLIPHIQFPLYKGVREMDTQELSEFELNIKRINSIILSDELLKTEFIKLTQRLRYTNYLEKYPKQLVRFVNHRLLPSTIKGYNAKLLLNLIRCEAHRNIIIQTLKNIESYEDSVYNRNRH